MKDKIKEIIESSIKVKKGIIENEEIILNIEKIINLLLKTFKDGRKLFLCGNGGSFSDALHVGAEFLGRFNFDREPLYAEVLGANPSYLTAVSNDYSYKDVFKRELMAKGKEGDVLFAFSTSGASQNVVEVVLAAGKIGIKTVCFTGKSGGELKSICDFILRVPSDDTPRIQEAHILLGHIIAKVVEERLFNKNV